MIDKSLCCLSVVFWVSVFDPCQLIIIVKLLNGEHYGKK